MRNKLLDKRILIIAVVVLVLIVVLASRGCGKDSISTGKDSSTPVAVTESYAGSESNSQAQDAGNDTAEGGDSEAGTATGTAAGGANNNDTADGVDQNSEGNLDQDKEHDPMEGGILENNGEIEIIVPEGQETYGE